MQKLIITGRLGREPEMRFTPAGQQVTNFSVATDRRHTTPQAAKKTATTCLNIAAWAKIAAVCNQYLHKGNQVGIIGRLKDPRCYQAQDGTWKASTIEVVAESVEFLTPKGANEEPEAEAVAEEIPF